VKNFEGSEFDVSTNTSKSDVTKKIDLDVLRTDEFPTIGDHVKSADEEVGDALKDTVGSAFGATKEKANEAGENLEEKTEAARKEASARADAAKARGEYTADSEWIGKATNDAVYPKAQEAKGLLGGFAHSSVHRVVGKVHMVANLVVQFAYVCW
jgi:hypothetical protein